VISVFARPTANRSFRWLAVVATAALVAGCAHVGRRRVLSTDEQLVASALSWAVRVPPRASEYRVEIPANYSAGPILAAAAADTRLVRRGTTLRRADEAGVSEPVRISVQTPERAVGPTQQEFRVPFIIATGGMAPITCVVRIRLRGDDPRSWLYLGEGEEHCWPRPGAWSTP
jgi:hypothetical protein